MASAAASERFGDIAARAATLWERLDMPRSSPGGDPRRVDARLSRWRHLVAGDDPRRFRRYLRWSDLDEAGARRACAPVDDARGWQPEWLTVVDQACRDVRPASIAAGDTFKTHALAGQPFAELIVPFLAAARRLLRAAAGSRYAELTDRAHADLEAALLMRLARIADRSFFAEFAAFRAFVASSRDGWRAALTPAIDARSTHVYRAFVERALETAFLDVFGRYPVLARLLAVTVRSWVAATAELLTAIAADRSALERTFGGGLPLGPVVSVVPQLSDPHRGGRTVCLLRFGAGAELVYKPHTTRPEAAFASVIRWLNDRRLSLALESPVTLDRGTHGWTQAVAARPCVNGREVAAYYRRAGMLLCLTYALGSADLHAGNLIACGEVPMLVDLEVMLSAQPRIGAPDGDSVLRTGLLPAASLGRHGVWYRGGALMPAPPPRPWRQWRHVNSDRMAPGAVADPAREAHVMDGWLAAHIDDIEAGLREMFGVLRRHRRALAGPDGPLARMRDQRHRVILRSTSVYASLLDRILDPSHLRDGAEWSIEIEQLKAGATQSESRPAIWPALAAEREALEQLDIPFFESVSSSTTLLTLGSATVPRFLAETASQGVHRRLARLDDEELEVQAHLTRLALMTAAPGSAALDAADRHGIEHDRHVAAALEIFCRLSAAAFESRTGEINWVAATREHGRALPEIRLLDWDLFNGRAGIALFFATVGAVTGNERAKALALQIFDPLVRRPAAHRPAVSRRLGMSGLGGLVYAMGRVGQLADSPALVDAATRLALLITPQAIERVRDLHVVSGAAGALLGLVSLYETTGEARMLDRARACGRRLLAEAPRAGGAAGFAHGRSGIAYSLARLYHHTRDALQRDFVVEGWRAHDAMPPQPAARRGRARAHALNTALRHSWCRGSSGIGLARAACATLTDTAPLLDVVPGLVDQSVGDAARASDVDHACCGHAGRVCFLGTVARRLNRPEWLAHATAIANRMIDRLPYRKMYTLGVRDDLLAPGFCQGLAGIGYELLRFRFDRLPAVLLLE